jgi:amino-acid N-acetyltransferase
MTQLAAAPIRPATRHDLADIERLLSDSDLPVAGVAEIMRAHPDHFFVAETTGSSPEIVGVAGLEVCCDDALLRSVAVHPEWRKHGVGRELVNRLVFEAEAQGIRALYLLTMTAEHYFPKFGFERIERGSVPTAIAETLEFKSACPASAVAMSRQLAAAS